MDHVLVVCTGNLCRSPIAAALLRHTLAERAVADVVVESAGTLGFGAAATREAQEVVAEQGADLSGHRARRIDVGLVVAADVVVGMTADHVIDLVHRAPSEAARIFKLSELARLAAEAPSRRADETLRGYAERLGAGRSDRPWVDSRAEPDVADPMGEPLEVYRETAARIGDHLRTFADSAWPERADGGAPGH